MEFEVQSTIAPIYGMTSVLMDAINAKYDSISNLNSIKLSAEEEKFEDINPVIDSIIEDENNHIGKLQQLIDLLSDSEDAIAEGKAETVEIIDNPEIMESITMKKKLVLNENFDNVIDDVQAVADPVFVGANEEHDENKENYEKVMKENEKNAEETIPEEGETGKKITSSDLKKMKLSEALNSEFVRNCADDICEYIITAFADLQDEEIREVLKYVNEYFEEEDFDESLTEEIKRYSDVVPYEKRKYWYFTTHGVGPGSIPKDLKVLEVKEGQNDKGTNGTYVCLDGVLNTSELRKYDMIEKAPMNESLQYKIAKEQIQRFTEGKMPKDWSVDNYLTKLTEKKHITSKEATSLKEWYDGKQKR